MYRQLAMAADATAATFHFPQHRAHRLGTSGPPHDPPRGRSAVRPAAGHRDKLRSKILAQLQERQKADPAHVKQLETKLVELDR